MIDLLWPECDLTAGRHSLAQALSSLRHQLEPPGVTPGTLIQADRSFVALNAEVIDLDVTEFSALVRTVGLEHSPVRLGALLHAAGLYRGELLPGVHEDWVVPLREALALQHLELLERLVAGLEAAHDHARGLEFALRAVDADPMRESSHAAVMRLYAATGRPEAALRQYAKLKRILKLELGERPSPELQALFREINRGQAGSPIHVEQLPTESPALHDGILCFMAVGIDVGSDAPGPAATSARLVDAVVARGGREVQRHADGFVAAFDRTVGALAAARGLETRFSGAHSGINPASSLRIALDTGEVRVDACGCHSRVLEGLPLLLLAARPGQILCSERFALLLADTTREERPLVDIGFFQLVEREQAERLFLVRPVDPAVAALPEARAAHPGNLPLQLTGFFGREEALSRIGAQLEPGLCRLVTLTGPGGSGKTRLGIEAARRQLERFHGAVWHVPLTAIDDPAQIISAIADALQIARGPQLDPWTRVVRALQGRPVLLVLDNFEQLLPHGAMAVKTLFERLRTLCCLVTSRVRLELEGEWELPVPPLPIPEGLLEPTALARNESVALFVDRARRVLPDFQITAHNAPVLAALCSRLEGIPLALELAAARVAMFTPSQLLERMEGRLDLLTSRRRDLPARHRTMRAAIDATYHVLDPATQRCFARLSIFRGGWSLEAAEAVTDDPGVLERLETLRACSLITTGEVSGSVRFFMLDTLREYAAEQLEPEERRAGRRRHAAFFAAFARPFARSSPRADTSFQRLSGERDNLREAAEWALSSDGELALSLELGDGLVEYWTWLGAYREGARWYASLLARPALASLPALRRAKALWRAADLHHRSGDTVDAPAWARESVALLGQDTAEEALERAFAVNLLGVMATERGTFAEARSHLEESLEIMRRLGSPVSISVVLYNLGRLDLMQGDTGQATRRLEESLPYRRQAGDLHGSASSLIGLGAAADRRGDFREALARAEEALGIFRLLGNEHMTATCLNNIGSAATGLGELELAQRSLEESLALRRSFGAGFEVAKVLANLGQLAHARGDLRRAVEHYREALALFRDADTPVETAFALADLAVVLAARGELERATVLLSAGARVWRERGVQLLEAERVIYARCWEALRAGLSREALERCRARGDALSLSEVVGLATGAGATNPSVAGRR